MIREMFVQNVHFFHRNGINKRREVFEVGNPKTFFRFGTSERLPSSDERARGRERNKAKCRRNDVIAIRLQCQQCDVISKRWDMAAKTYRGGMEIALSEEKTRRGGNTKRSVRPEVT